MLTDSKDGVVIHNITSGSLFSSTDLKVGMKILAVNGRPCPFSAYQVVDQIKKEKGQVKIVAQFPLSYMQMYKKVKDAQEEAAKYKNAFFLCGETPLLG
jgi:C-terminal processing protease CtpA/Prc